MTELEPGSTVYFKAFVDDKNEGEVKLRFPGGANQEVKPVYCQGLCSAPAILPTGELVRKMTVCGCMCSVQRDKEQGSCPLGVKVQQQNMARISCKGCLEQGVQWRRSVAPKEEAEGCRQAGQEEGPKARHW